MKILFNITVIITVVSIIGMTILVSIGLCLLLHELYEDFSERRNKRKTGVPRMENKPKPPKMKNPYSGNSKGPERN